MDKYKMDVLEFQKKIEELSTAFKKIALDTVPDFAYNISEMKNKELRKEIGYVGIDRNDIDDEKVCGKNEVLHSCEINGEGHFTIKELEELIIELNIQLMNKQEAEEWLNHFPHDDEYLMGHKGAMVVSFDQFYKIFADHYNFNPDHKYVYAEDA